MTRVLLFCQWGVATGEVVRHVDARFNRDDHAWCQHSISVNRQCVMCVHAEEVANVVRIKTIHRLNIHKQRH